MPCPDCGSPLYYVNPTTSSMKGREYEYTHARCIGKIERQGFSTTKTGEKKWRIKYHAGKEPCGWTDGVAQALPKVIKSSGTMAETPLKHTPVKTDHRTYLIDFHSG
tara:strand:+ start:1170 stop:1490 length:321 start_codon:yes stop_codon:yes gene_type:complete